jgi:hypothetical protein
MQEQQEQCKIEALQSVTSDFGKTVAIVATAAGRYDLIEEIKDMIKGDEDE